VPEPHRSEPYRLVHEAGCQRDLPHSGVCFPEDEPHPSERLLDAVVAALPLPEVARLAALQPECAPNGGHRFSCRYGYAPCANAGGDRA
jgi:hypothetical protein